MMKGHCDHFQKYQDKTRLNKTKSYLVDEGRNLPELLGERPHVLLADGDLLPAVQEEDEEVLLLLLDGQSSLPETLVESQDWLLSADTPGAVNSRDLVVHQVDQLDVVLALDIRR